ncbi:putative amino acid transporter, transmembrane domain-containing protein [Helianthus anomalus]
MAVFAVIQIVLSQIPNFHKLSWLSILAAVMSFAYSLIGVGLSFAKVAGGVHTKTTLCMRLFVSELRKITLMDNVAMAIRCLKSICSSARSL